MTLNALIDRIKAVAQSHGQVNYFFFGTADDYLQMNDVPKHASVMLSLKGATFLGDRFSTTKVDFALYVMDWSGLETTGQSELWSDTLQILHDLLSSLKDETVNDFTVAEDISLSPFNEKFADNLTGWMADISFVYDSGYDRCAIPN